jgi:hypothetical protein
MPIRSAIWKVSKKPQPLAESSLGNEKLFEDMIVIEPRIPEWLTKLAYSAKGSEFDRIYVNGGNNLENFKTHDDTWKMRLIEEDFHRLMIEMEGA